MSLLDHHADYWEPIRKHLIPRIDRFLRFIGLPGATARVTQTEYVGRVNLDEETLEEQLTALGYERNPLAAWKTTPEGVQEAGSWAKYGPTPHITDGRQIHIMLFNTNHPGQTDVYAHEEPHHIEAPIKHYFGHTQNPEKGVAVVREELKREGINPTTP